MSLQNFIHYALEQRKDLSFNIYHVKLSIHFFTRKMCCCCAGFGATVSMKRESKRLKWSIWFTGVRLKLHYLHQSFHECLPKNLSNPYEKWADRPFETLAGGFCGSYLSHHVLNHQKNSIIVRPFIKLLRCYGINQNAQNWNHTNAWQPLGRARECSSILPSKMCLFEQVSFQIEIGIH